ncbi:MAG: transposase [Syntrophorhabdales bacterium]|jgi:hypothetical protein
MFGKSAPDMFKGDRDPYLDNGCATAKTAAHFLAELGGYRNFEFYKKVLAYARLDPTIHQSGKYEGMLA